MKAFTATFVVAAVVLGGVGLAYGLGVSPARVALASPSLPPVGTLGIGKMTVAPVSGPFGIESKIKTAAAKDSVAPLLAQATRVAAPLPKPEPAAPTVQVASVSAARSSSPAPSRSTASTTGWSSATASWYGPGFYGNSTASGMILTESSMIVAHRTLAFGTKIQFEYNGRSCTATVQDRGPHVSGRVFDLGPGTAKALGFSGVGTVKYRIVG